VTPGALVFWLLALLVLGSAAYVALTRNVVRAAFALFGTFFGVAGLYAWLGADFLFGVQLIVYAGGILVLLLFGVMLTRHSTEMLVPGNPVRWAPAAIISLGLAGLLLAVVLGSAWLVATPAVPASPTTHDIGRLLLSRFVLPFEVASLVLLAVMVGAAVIARRAPVDRP
jgi:NADH-quinone oxidoreductase subunit J